MRTLNTRLAQLEKQKAQEARIAELEAQLREAAEPQNLYPHLTMGALTMIALGEDPEALLREARELVEADRAKAVTLARAILEAAKNAPPPNLPETWCYGPDPSPAEILTQIAAAELLETD